MKEGKEMRQCRNSCGKETSDNTQFCSIECATQYKDKVESRRKSIKRPETANIQNNNIDKNVFWSKGDGMVRRNHNIDIIKNLMISGKNYPEIVRSARRFLTTNKIDEYYEIAQDEVNNGIDGNES